MQQRLQEAQAATPPPPQN